MPAGQAAHVPLPPVLKLPVEQFTGEADPSGQKLPCGQSVHSLCALAPAALRYVPASHAIAALAPYMAVDLDMPWSNQVFTITFGEVGGTCLYQATSSET